MLFPLFSFLIIVALLLALYWRSPSTTSAGGASRTPGCSRERQLVRGRSFVAAAVAIGTLVFTNAWVAGRLSTLLADTSLGQFSELERRIAAFPRDRVQVLVLGNSQALAGLRPPVLGEALGLGPDGVFSLAMVGGSPHEMRLLLERYAPSFPHATTILCGVNESFLTTETELRLRQLTLGRPAERLALAEGRPLELQLRLLAGTWLPLLDFGTSLREAVLARPKSTLAGLVRDPRPFEPPLGRGFRWGVTPKWDTYDARALRWLRDLAAKQAYIDARAHRFTAHADRAAAGVRQLDQLAREARQRAQSLVLVEMPYAPALAAAIERQRPGSSQAWRGALEVWPALARARRVPAPTLPPDAYYDVDHLAPGGAQRLAAGIAAALASPGPAPAAGGAQKRK